VAVAGGEEHLVAQLKDQRQAHPQLYNTMGAGVAKLSSDELATMVADQTGACAETMLAHLKAGGHTDMSREALRNIVKLSMSDVETGSIVVPNLKKQGRTITAAWLRVVCVWAALAKTVGNELAMQLISWPGNIPDGEMWVGIAADKGCGATKLVAKFNNCELADSWRHTCLLAMLSTWVIGSQSPPLRASGAQQVHTAACTA
jgi:hypothetical protein